MEAGQQNHRLPPTKMLLTAGRRIGVDAGPGERPGDVLLRRVREAFAVVDEILSARHSSRGCDRAGTAFELKPVPRSCPIPGTNRMTRC